MPWETARERAMPLVPQPFRTVSISRQSLFSGSRPLARSRVKFCPNLNVPQYVKSLSDQKKTELDQKANKLFQRAICNQAWKASEFCWEVSAWTDVFGLLYDDDRFLIDKRPYEFLEIDDGGKEVVKKRIPDATIGLKSHDDLFLKQGYLCSVPDCREDHSAMQPDERLSERQLRGMMHDPECGLVVDGVWGKTDLLFPFAVYEAKKRARHYQQAENQIHHACRTYLAMLDDLARNPDNVTEYQTEESSKYQMFAFASCGSYWQVFAVWNFLHDCMVETIWEGDVKESSRAFDLICIVDQVHDYAVNHHRPFVMNHLEAWHARHQKTVEPFKKVFGKPNAATASMDVVHEDPDASSLDSADNNNDLYDFNNDSDIDDFGSDDDDSDSCSWDFDKFGEFSPRGPKKPAEWLRLKEQSEKARKEIANETRRRNRSLKIPQAPQLAKEPLNTKPRGRLRKARFTNKEAPKGGTGKLLEKARPRGRPRKAGVAKKEAPKRGRGRPRKVANRIIKTGLV